MTRTNFNGIDRDMTPDEEAIYQTTVIAINNDLEQQRQLEEATEAAKQSARAKLAALGLSDNEISALVGA